MNPLSDPFILHAAEPRDARPRLTWRGLLRILRTLVLLVLVVVLAGLFLFPTRHAAPSAPSNEFHWEIT